LDSEISELRSEIIKLNQDLEWKEEENVKMKQKVAKLEHKARRMSDVYFSFLLFKIFIKI